MSGCVNCGECKYRSETSLCDLSDNEENCPLKMLDELAEKFNGREYSYEMFTDEEKELARCYDILIVSGASDDLMELEGALYDEINVYDGGEAYIGKRDNIGWVVADCKIDDGIKVTAKWNEDDIDWSYSTNAKEYREFDIMEDGKVYTRGMVILLR